MAAAKGNNYSSKNNRLWADTLRRACVQANGKKLRGMAEALIAKALEGDVSAIKEVGDRIDGKVPQMIQGDEDNPLTMITKIERVIVRPSDKNG